MYRKLLAGLCMFASVLTASAQSTTAVTGTAMDSTTKQGVPFVTITVQDSQKKTVKQLAGGADGKYEFSLKGVNKGKIIISAVGYGTATKDFSFAKGATKYTVPTIMMSESNTKIDQVVVQGQKQLIKIEPDKISYNPEADPETQTLNALDMMRKVPLLAVDGEDKISLKGASNFKILINGKESPLMSNNASDILKSMPANSIKNIEVITNPSSKYSADGVGGIINIITTKNSISGFSGTVSARVDNFGGFGGSLYSTAKLGKFAFSVNYGYNRNKRPSVYNDIESTSPSLDNYYKTLTSTSNSSKGNSNNISGDLSYEIDSLNLITASFWGYFGKVDGNSFNITSVSNKAGELTQSFTNNGKSESSRGMGSATIDFQHSYLKPDKLLTASYMVDLTPVNTENESDINPIYNYFPSRTKSDNDASAFSHTFQLDFVNPISENHQYEIGAKYILRTNDSDTENKSYNFEKEVYEASYNAGNEMDYTQNIFAGYVGYTYKLKNFSTKVGARVEGAYTDASSTQKGVKTSFDNNLTDVVPYATIAYNISPTNSIKFSYTQRLQRPGIWYLNPYVNDLDPKNISYGNPDLETEKVNSFDLGYSYFAMKYSLNLSLYSRLDDNAIQDITFVNDDGATVSTYNNSGHNYAHGLSLYGSVTPTQQLNISVNTNFEYSTIEGQDKDGNALSNEGWSNTITGNIRWNFLKNYTVSAYGGFYDGWITLQSKTSSMDFSGISLRRDFLDKKLSLTLSCNNPFKKYTTYTNTTTSDNFISSSRIKGENRSFRIALSYRFGKMGQTVVKTKRSITNDDLKSGSSEGGSSSEGGMQQ